MLKVDNLSCELDDVRIFSDVGFAVDAGQALLITGGNGAGKTTLLRVLAGLLPKCEGEVSWQGTPVSALGPVWYQQLQYLGHRPGLKADLTVMENLRLGEALFGKSKDLSQLLELVGLKAYHDSAVYTLSRGQTQRLAIARLQLSQATLWLMDEPLTALDVDAHVLVTDAVATHVSTGGMAIVTSHQPFALKQGEIKRLHMGACLEGRL